MAFTATSENINGIATITLSGELDAASAPAFKAEVDRAVAEHDKRLVLQLQGLEYIASAGLRVLIFAKQKLGSGSDIYVVGAQDQILDTLRKTGFDHSVIITETYNPDSEK